MAGKKENKQVTTSNNDPWAPLVPHLTSLFTQGQTALNNTPKSAESTYAGPNQNQLTAADWIKNAAPGLSTGAADLRQLGVDTIQGKYLDPATNPWLEKSVQGAIDLNTRNLNTAILPALADQAIMGGAYGGSGYGVAQGMAVNDANTANTNAATGAYAQNYQLERDRQMGAGTLLDQANQLSLAPGTVLGGLGDMEQGWAQNQLDANIAAPWNGLDRYAALLGLGTGFGANTTTQTTPGKSGFGSFLSGATGGASAGAAFGPWGAGIGGVLGGLGGLFG